jgi:predicted permease
MVRSLTNLINVNPGFDGRNVLTLRFSIPAGVIAPDSTPGFYDALQAAIAALPGVQDVALADCPPLSGGCNGTIMTLADHKVTATGNAIVGLHWVSPNWFGAMHVPLVRGRFLTSTDRAGTGKVVLINETAARKFFPGEDPVGKRVAIYQGGLNTGAEVVGIVGDVRFDTIDSTAGPDTYASFAQGTSMRLMSRMIFVRTSHDPRALAPTVRALIRRVAPRDPVYDIKPMSDRVAAASAQARFATVLLSLFAALSLSLAVIGIYGVMSFGVAQRTREIGIRVALGADRRRVLRLVLREGALLAGTGVVIGLAAALALTRVLRTMLFEVTTTDPPVYGVMVVVVAAAVFVACWIPARRAARVDPMVALRRG